MHIKQVTLRSASTFSKKTNTATGGTCNTCAIPGRHLSLKVVPVHCSMLLLQSRGGLNYEPASNGVIKFRLDIDTDHHCCYMGDNKKR